jgi:NADH:ubiquinone oxidoreductase subunit 6 (subunit J)
MSGVFFFIAAIGALAGAGGVVLVRNPFYSVLALVGHLISLAALFLLLRAEFIAAAQVVVYAGAVMVLYVFVVAYIGGGDAPQVRAPVGRGQKALAVLFAAAIAAELFVATLGTALRGVGHAGAPYQAGFGAPAQIGTLLLTRFLLPFEVASFLLLIAAVGAVALARRRGGIAGEVAEAPSISVAQLLRPADTGTMAEAVGATSHLSRSAVAPGRTSGEREHGPDEGAGW